jgi:hypothetical protein
VSATVALCVMCFRTAAAQGVERSRVMNSGILILLIPPVLVLGLILLLALRKNRITDPTVAADVSENVSSPPGTHL